jgi:hypothetical protein
VVNQTLAGHARPARHRHGPPSGSGLPLAARGLWTDDADWSGESGTLPEMATPSDLHPGLIALMAAQGQVFSGAQARSFGHTPDDIQRLRASPPYPLMSVRRGVYTWRAAYESAKEAERYRIRIAAVALCLDGNAVLSHESAGAVVGLAMLDPGLEHVHVTRQAPARPRIEAALHHHVAELIDLDTEGSVFGMEVTSIARTAVDIARETDRLEVAVAVLDSALRAGVSRRELWDVFARCRSWPGARLVATAIAFADKRADNPGESWSRVVLMQQGVPATSLQVPVHDEQGLVGYADFGWPGVLGEFDGKGKYGLATNDPNPDDEPLDPEKVKRLLWKEKVREDRLRVGHEVVRWGMAELYAPSRLAVRVRAAQSRAALRFGSPFSRTS